MITPHDSQNEIIPPMTSTVFDLRVRNHPGTMSHITGLFARRAFNLEAIRCAPIGDGSESRMLLLVATTPRLEQIERQLARLHDVISVCLRSDLTAASFQIEEPDERPLLAKGQ